MSYDEFQDCIEEVDSCRVLSLPDVVESIDDVDGIGESSRSEDLLLL